MTTKATVDTSITRKGSEISISTNTKSDVLSPENPGFQVTSSSKKIQDTYKIQEAAENRHMSLVEEDVRTAATPARNSRYVKQLRGSAASSTADIIVMTHNEDTITRSPA